MAIDTLNGAESGVEIGQKINEIISTNNTITLTGAVTGTGEINLETGELEIQTTDNSTKALNLLKQVYPIGSIYIGTTQSCPIAYLFGTWERVAYNQCLWGASSEEDTDPHVAGDTIPAGLPNVTGKWVVSGADGDNPTLTGAFYRAAKHTSAGKGHNSGQSQPTIGLNASKSSTIFGSSDTVQPPAFVVNVWQRVA